MQNNHYDTGPPSKFDQILPLLGIDRASISDGSPQLQQVRFNNIETRNAYLELAGVPAAQRDAFPLEITVLAAANITITASDPLVINPGNNSPVTVHFDTVTMETGGQIQCNTAVVMTVENFIKN